MGMDKKTAIIIGAGPAGLTAAYELLHKTNIKPIIFEETLDIGGISKTVNYKGNRIDIGGHRFFSKSEQVMKWWQNIIPLENEEHDPTKTDKVMLLRSRLSRIFFLRKFFSYPVSLSVKTLKNLGLIRTAKIGISYIKVRLFPIKKEKTLEDFFINRFGKELYKTFFKDYTEKVWGVPCQKIKPEWGRQRIKGLSISKAILSAIKSIFKKDESVSQKGTETSLINRFTYPKLGPGQMWEEVARIIKQKGGEIHKNQKVTGIKTESQQITEVTTSNGKTIKGDYFFSTMPVRDLIASLTPQAPKKVRRTAKGLMYRDFITVGLLLKKLKPRSPMKDNWVYIQERDVKVGRLQIFNNWSPYMVKNKDHIWIGLEYFCSEGDELWNMSDKKFISFAIDELVKIDIIEKEDVIDQTLIRVPKTYPAYFGTYDNFDTIREFTDELENLFLIGRNGMHRYNNQDHSMLTAITAVENIAKKRKSKDNIWSVNIEEEYHEEKTQKSS